MTLAATYVLPLRWTQPRSLDELSAYLAQAGAWVDEVLGVDGAPHDRFVEHAKAWLDLPGVRVLRPDPDLRGLNGKVNGVVSGIRHADHERVVIADDDVRYEEATLDRVVGLLDAADAVRPQNYFDPLPWHARLDTGRTLLNRAIGADFPGTLGVRRSTVLRAGGYDGDVLFENLELLRTVEAVGGTVVAPLDCYVRRLPPTTDHFLNQRVRQAYDDLTRPAHLAAALCVLPLITPGRWPAALAVATASAGLAELGRRRAGGRAVFPATSSLLAPVWVAERAVCSWIALGLWATRYGCPYAGTRFLRAATPVRRLRALYSAGATGSEVMSASG